MKQRVRSVCFGLFAALAIVGAGDDDKAIQAALHDAYESGKLRGKNLIAARRIIERRQTLGRSVARGVPRKRNPVDRRCCAGVRSPRLCRNGCRRGLLVVP